MLLMRLNIGILVLSIMFLVQSVAGDEYESCVFDVIPPSSQSGLREEFYLAIADRPFTGIREFIGVARSWSQLSFVIHMNTCLSSWSSVEDFNVHWCKSPAGVPAQREVSNIYIVLGFSFFADTGMHNPRLAALILGTSIQCFGASNVMWTTEPVPRALWWEIELMRRFEIPEDLQEAYGFTPLGGHNSQVRKNILNANRERLERRIGRD